MADDSMEISRVRGEVIAEPGIAQLATEELREQLAGLLAQTADDLRRMAEIVGELERRGEDLTELRLGILDHLRRIASGQLLPELVVRLSGYPALLRVGTALPLPDQERLASGDPLPLAVWRGERIEWRQVEPLALTAAQLRQVFAGDRIRTQAEQVSLLEARREKTPRPRAKRARVRADPERGGIVIGRSFAALEDVLLALAQLGESDYQDDVEGERKVVPTNVSAAEHQQLKVRAAKSDSSMGHLVRRAMAAYGLIRPGSDV